MKALAGIAIHVNGVVQGVGFRPFVYGLATRLNLKGWVRNTSAGVDIQLDGPPADLDAFVTALQTEAPPLARIDEVSVSPREPDGFTEFKIVHSQGIPDAFQPISPDVSICEDCLRELFDPHDRRYRYPFINCTNCGPRFTIIKDIPYDRPLTTMAPFEMCPDCAAEYEDPLDRRFHAQPVACPVCGPQVWFEHTLPEGADIQYAQRGVVREAAIAAARNLLAEGNILAVKGLGGFHLACDATNEVAVAELRRRKLRVDKPFALMMLDVETVEKYCLVNAAERALLESRQRPIVVLNKCPDSAIAASLAPGQTTLGVMLPYTPLHYLLVEATPDFPDALVMTSGNLSEEPIASQNEDARQRLAPLADAFLMHDRDIYIRCDDSVVRVFSADENATNPDETIYPLRRSRGYAPFPVRLPWEMPPVLAAGAELKNTFCLTKDRYAFLSQHIGDLENYETLHSFEKSVAHFERLFRVTPQALAYDLHPDYMATRYALDRAEREGIPAVGVQHHHGHIAACMAEHGLPEDGQVIGVAFDGTGYGDDCAIWGGEFLVATYNDYERPLHLAYSPLPGGDLAVKQPWRLALAWLHQTGLGWETDLPPLAYMKANLENPDRQLEVLHHQLEHGVNAPPTSSMGRLFDAAAALAGVRQTVNYEAQAAIEFEALADLDESGAYEFAIQDGVVDPSPMFQALAADVHAGAPLPKISALFHNGVAQMTLEACRELRQTSGLNEVALSGGVWQNMRLLANTVKLLKADRFQVYLHRKVPANDGGLALGQVVVAVRKLQIAD